MNIRPVAIVLLMIAMPITGALIVGVEHDVGNGMHLSSMHNDVESSIDPDTFLTSFDYGRVSILEDGTVLREFTVTVEDVTLEVAPNIYFDAWTYNGSIPGPTLRATEGDRVRVTFLNNGSHPHTIHFHGKHPAEMDGVFPMIPPGGRFVYEFTAEPFGLHLYHCHVDPVAEHINRGLYGVFIVDPRPARESAKEMVMVLNGYDTDFDRENNFYTVNGVPFHYVRNPIEVKRGELVRIYLVNMTEFDLINNFHLHGDLFRLYRTGTSLVPDEFTDMVTLSQGERAILEFRYDYPGLYMFHAHVIEFSDKGWMGFFKVVDDYDDDDEGSSSSDGNASDDEGG
ncbi:MAG: multicopper oxidase domain-containing protein [Candidatus Nitrosocaldus sp.]|nr:multicopper oxidase domain-containing protein [Candidatus Nitrosocaldus sp.]MDW8276324.1 multicopper oxidase domain-containing protein [Candidatus Nitrosocaldus sp.]